MKLALEGVIVPPKGKERFWGIGVPLLEIYSQGKSRKDALKMIEDAVTQAVGESGFKVDAKPVGETFALVASDIGILIAFMLRQQRVSKGLSLRAAAEKLGSSSPNTFGRYEQRDSSMTIEKLLELVGAVSEKEYLLLKAG